MLRISYILVRLLLIFSAALLIQSSAMSQDRETDFGIYISPMLTGVSSVDDLIQSGAVRLGMRFGAHLDIPLNNWLYVHGGFGFAFNMGGNILHNYPGDYLPKSDIEYPATVNAEFPIPAKSTITYKLNVMEVPIGLGYHWGKEDKSWYVNFPVFQLNLSNRVRGDIKNQSYTLEDLDIDGDVKDIFLAWGFSAGRKIRASNGNQYNIGVSWRNVGGDISKDKGNRLRTDQTPERTEKEDSSLRLQYVSIIFGIDF